MGERRSGPYYGFHYCKKTSTKELPLGGKTGANFRKIVIGRFCENAWAFAFSYSPQMTVSFA